MKESEPRKDDKPAKGTEKPWERPGQSSQNPQERPPKKPDLERWKDSETH